MAILLVDDSKDDLLLVESYLKADRYQVITLDSAERALKYLTELAEGKPLAPIELILLDVKMPGFDEAAFTWLREGDPSTSSGHNAPGMPDFIGLA